MKNKFSHPSYANHKIVTRRDFLSHGLISFSALISLPSVFGLGMRHAIAASKAAECGAIAGSNMMPFMVFDMAGGAALPANFLVGKQGGPMDLLTSYTLLGWNPKESGALNTDFGLPMSAKYSKILEGILTNSSVEARRNLRMGSICHFAQDDSSSNKMNAGTLALRAGLRGSFITNGLCINDTLSGGRSSPVQESTALKPTFVRSITDVLGATNFGGSSLKDVGVDKLKSLAEGGVDLSRVQKELYKNHENGDILAELSKCAYEKSLDFVQGVEGLDPRLEANAQAVYQIDQNTNAGQANAVAAALVMNTLNGYSGPSVWTLGDCDYHDGTQTTGDNQDLQMGVQIGRALELAHRYKKPFFFQLLTDGGCDAESGTRNWRGDSGDKCMTVMGYYDPNEAPKMIRTQVGHFTNGQGAERSTLLGSEPLLVGYAVLANYLNVCGKISEFRNLAPGIFTGAGQLESVLLFEGKRT